MESTPARVVVCMKWGSKYGPEYVNRLYGMVRRNLSGEFRFVCLTDDTSGVRAEVECFPLPELELAASARDGGWRKLNSFRKDLYGLTGRALFLDLDVAVVGGLDEFFTQPGKFVIIKDWKRPWRVTGNSSVYRFDLGAHADVLAYFVAHQDEVRQRHRNEQEFLSHYLSEQKQLSYWPAGWCCSFKYHCIPAWPLNYWQEPAFPAGTRIVVFHGEVNPPDAIAGRRNRALRYMKAAPWVARYWAE